MIFSTIVAHVWVSFLFFFAVSQVFKDLDFLGWYTTGNTANESDLKVHQQASKTSLYYVHVQDMLQEY